MKYIHVMFPNTKGGTELGINIDTESCDLTKADFNKGKRKRARMAGESFYPIIKA